MNPKFKVLQVVHIKLTNVPIVIESFYFDKKLNKFFYISRKSGYHFAEDELVDNENKEVA